MSKARSLVRVAAVVLCAALPACYVRTEPVAVTSAEVETDGYVPAYYDGYLVYYDDGGRPFYYSGGSVVWISAGSPYYAGLRNHWRVYGPAYHRWYGHYGYRYRGYRASPGYHAYHGYRGGHRR